MKELIHTVLPHLDDRDKDGGESFVCSDMRGLIQTDQGADRAYDLIPEHLFREATSWIWGGLLTIE